VREAAGGFSNQRNKAKGQRDLTAGGREIRTTDPLTTVSAFLLLCNGQVKSYRDPPDGIVTLTQQSPFALSQPMTFSVCFDHMATSNRPKIRTRYSIGEWYGLGFEALTPAERFTRAKTECDTDAILGAVCPFQRDAKCNKKGGVCSLRQYQKVSGGPVSGAGPVITTCPQRFLESDTIFRWVGETLLQTKEPIVLSEIGFLDQPGLEDRPQEVA